MSTSMELCSCCPGPVVNHANVCAYQFVTQYVCEALNSNLVYHKVGVKMNSVITP